MLSIAVWDLLIGKNKAAVVGQDKVTIDNKERIFPNYEASEFLESTPLKIGDYSLKADDEKTVELINELFKLVPDEISTHAYTPWTDETKNEVN